MSIKRHCESLASPSGKHGAVGALIALILCAPVSAGPNEQAERMYERIAGVAPSSTELSQMASDIQSNNALAAAQVALASPTFYNTVLKNWAMPWTNKTQTVFAPLNDYVATVIGMVRDDVPFNTALSADILYTSNAPGLPAPALGNDNHYQTDETQGVDLYATLHGTTQSWTYGTPTGATAGLITIYGAEAAFF